MVAQEPMLLRVTYECLVKSVAAAETTGYEQDNEQIMQNDNQFVWSDLPTFVSSLFADHIGSYMIPQKKISVKAAIVDFGVSGGAISKWAREELNLHGIAPTSS